MLGFVGLVLLRGIVSTGETDELARKDGGEILARLSCKALWGKSVEVIMFLAWRRGGGNDDDMVRWLVDGLDRRKGKKREKETSSNSRDLTVAS